MISLLSDAGHVTNVAKDCLKFKTANKCIPYAGDGTFSFFLQLNA